MKIREETAHFLGGLVAYLILAGLCFIIFPPLAYVLLGLLGFVTGLALVVTFMATGCSLGSKLWKYYLDG